MKRYSELLPSYLNGENVLRHAEILEEQDNRLYDEILLLNLAFDLERPILIEKVQTQPAICTVNVYVHTQSPVRKVTVTEDCNLVQEYEEEDLITQETYTFTCSDPNVLVSPHLVVTVETYEGETYTKAYPENDTQMGNSGDHDEALDRIGALLGIPRRLYVEQQVGQRVDEYLKLYPPFFTKQGEGKQVGDIYTEDDYYYKQRLVKFTEEYNKKPLVILMAELLYEWNDVQYSNMLTRDTSITEDIYPYIHQPILQIINKAERYTNMDYTNMKQILEQYIPVTRDIVFSQEYAHTEQIIEVDSAENFNNISLSAEVYAYNEDYSEEKTVLNAPIHLYYQSNKIPRTYFDTIYTGNAGTIYEHIGGLPSGNATLIANYDGEYEFPSVEDGEFVTSISPRNQSDMTLQAWEWGRYTGTQSSQYIEPFTDTIGLCVGRRCLCYSPALNPYLIPLNETVLDIWFRYTKQYSKIGLVRVEKDSEGLLRQRGNWFDPYSFFREEGSTSTRHKLTVEFLNNTLTYYIDEQKTGITQRITGKETLYLAGYSIQEVSLQTRNGLYISSFRYRNNKSITDQMSTTDNVMTTDSISAPAVATEQDITGVNASYDTYGKTFFKYPLKRGTNSSLKFKAFFNTTQARVTVQFSSLKKNNIHHVTPIREYVPSWAKWGNKNGQDFKGGSMNVNTWHDIEFRIEGNNLSVYADNTLQFTEEIPVIDSENPYFNDYFFLTWARWQSSTTKMIISQVQYTSDTYISEEERTTVYEMHKAQF